MRLLKSADVRPIGAKKALFPLPFEGPICYNDKSDKNIIKAFLRTEGMDRFDQNEICTEPHRVYACRKPADGFV